MEIQGGGGDRRLPPLWKNLRRRLPLKRIIGFRRSSNWVLMDVINAGEEPSPAAGDIFNPPSASCGASPAGDGAAMNLATALAIERQTINGGRTDGVVMTPLKSLVRSPEEMDGGDVKDEDGRGKICTVCCLCTERKKAAVLIPCGHTYCRVCSRGVMLNQGTCPLCSRRIADILHI